MTISAGPTAVRGWRLAGLIFVFLWFLVGGIAHFVATDTEMRILPPWVPWPRATVLVSGGLELAGAMALLWRPSRRLAGWGLFALTLAVTPANVYMLQHAGQFAVPYWALVLRLPLQVALLALILWSTAAPRSGPRTHRSATDATADIPVPPKPLDKANRKDHDSRS